MKALLMLCLLFSSSVFAANGEQYVRQYLSDWLEAHEFKDFQVSENGIKINSVGLTLDGEIYGITELKEGELYSAETQLTASLSNGKNLEDFAAGLGPTPTDAFLDALNNFCFTTLHPIYAEFLNHNDPHVNKYEWELSGKKRNIFYTSWINRGDRVEADKLQDVEKNIQLQLSKLNLSDDVHWVKLVVSSAQGKLKTVVLTVDGLTYEELNTEIADYNWPSQGTYMVKLFLVVGKA